MDAGKGKSHGFVVVVVVIVLLCFKDSAPGRQSILHK